MLSALKGLWDFFRQHALVRLNRSSGSFKQAVDAGSSPVERAIAPKFGPPTHYVIIRRDLPLGVIVSQTVHAAGESALGRVTPDTHAVALAARDEAHLADIERELIELGFEHRAIREPDRDNELMAIGIPPLVDRNLIKPVTRQLKLLG